MINKMSQNTSDKKEKNLPSPTLALTLEAASFWDYKTKEDKIARNIWICFTMGLLTISCLIFILNGTARFSGLLSFT